MEFRTIVDIPDPGFRIGPCESMLFVGSCFADSIGRRFQEEKFRTVVNPFGVMYNPASILHTIQRIVKQGDGSFVTSAGVTKEPSPCYAFLTLGTNHVYRLKETGEIVDNCQKRPQSLFEEEELSVDECADYLTKAIDLLREMNPETHIVLTVSPIRYRKYGYHESQLSKATLLLAIEKTIRACKSSMTSKTSATSIVSYFPAYEIMMDELRDYRFYDADMLHPSEQAVDYIWERLIEWCFSDEAITFMDEWRPIRQALTHRPFNPESKEYLRFMQQTHERLAAFKKKYPAFTQNTKL